MMISLKQTFGSDAEYIKEVLMMFGGPSAQIVAWEKRKEGMEKAVNHANALCEDWSDKAFEALKDYIKTKSTFITEELRQEVNIPTMKPAAWGAVISRAVKSGLIKQVGWQSSSGAAPHARQAIVWGVV
jgi:hypothetical protein